MQPTKKEMQKYENHLKVEAEKFELDANDLSNLYDFMNIVETPLEMQMDFWRTLKINKLDDWYVAFLEKIERIVIPELYEPYDPKKEKKHSKGDVKAKQALKRLKKLR